MNKHSPAALEMAREIANLNAPFNHNTDILASIIDAGNAELVAALRAMRKDLLERECHNSANLLGGLLTNFSVPK